ncbi:antitoxin Xre/MbcA/ParS toxin-binding domain-containing protein [Lysinibacter cavernae]|uniref:Uncharacterized protein (DUF2384 family) n=1 Tax=Lysinibacter cavernae TaxID=1640652 RepID=A0A7X5R0A0_9MICO|nr:antitoxin Xre/MbcA/ParS toxin-binding domain-containing protein [Lysinibacter cavernae]NIH53142.1 uncharacterized protein (DUF2384 family) [Lysinibacter cavernae]
MASSRTSASLSQPLATVTAVRPRATNVFPLHAAQERTEFLIGILGSNKALADLLNVSPSQPSRWRSGKEVPSPQSGRELIDLDYVLARASQVWPPAVALQWLEGHNSFLGGARPIDVLRSSGAAEVIEALDGALAGAYA